MFHLCPHAPTGSHFCPPDFLFLLAAVSLYPRSTSQMLWKSSILKVIMPSNENCIALHKYVNVTGKRQLGVWLANQKLCNEVNYSENDDRDVDTNYGNIERHLLSTCHQIDHRRQEECVHKATQRARKPARNMFHLLCNILTPSTPAVPNCCCSKS